MDLGTKANKNVTRDKMRTDNPVTEDNGKKVGMERSNDKSESVSDVASDRTNIK